MNRVLRLAAPLALGAALLAPPVTASGAVTGGQQSVRQPVQAPTAYGRSTTISRAKTWLTANRGRPVPYSMTKNWGGYRMDCSGYASMALSLPKSGPNTVALATSKWTRKINMSQLVVGDLVIDPVGGASNRHVVIFEKWTSSAHRSYLAYEQRGGHGTTHRTLSYGVGKDQFDAYRPLKY
jgi:hypothetical protein